MRNILLSITLAFLITAINTNSLVANNRGLHLTEKEPGSIHLASAPVLRDAINNAFRSPHFTEKSKLPETLAGRTLHPVEIPGAVQSAMEDYLNQLSNSGQCDMAVQIAFIALSLKKHSIIEAILNAKDPSQTPT